MRVRRQYRDGGGGYWYWGDIEGPVGRMYRWDRQYRASGCGYMLTRPVKGPVAGLLLPGAHARGVLADTPFSYRAWIRWRRCPVVKMLRREKTGSVVRSGVDLQSNWPYVIDSLRLEPGRSPKGVMADHRGLIS